MHNQQNYRFGPEFKKAADKNAEEWRVYCEGVHLARLYIEILSGKEVDDVQSMTAEQHSLWRLYSAGDFDPTENPKSKRIQPEDREQNSGRAIGFIEERLAGIKKKRGAEMENLVRVTAREIVSKEIVALSAIFL